jgi:hypothetical protein
MDALTLTISLALTAGVFGLILYPLWQQTRPEALQTGRSGQTLEEYQARYQATLDAIKDLMFDHEMGKTSADDYDKLLAKTKLEAAGIRHQIDRLSRSVATDVEAALDVEIERLVAQLRHSQPAESAALLAEVEAEIDLLKNIRLESAEMDEATCPHCGQPFLPGDAFCSGCGQPLPDLTAAESPAKVDICSACGYAYQAGDAFCARCGLALTAELKVSPREDVITR